MCEQSEQTFNIHKDWRQNCGSVNAKLINILRSNYYITSVLADVGTTSPMKRKTLPTVNVDKTFFDDNCKLADRRTLSASESASNRKKPYEKSTLNVKKSMTIDADYEIPCSSSSSESSDRCETTRPYSAHSMLDSVEYGNSNFSQAIKKYTTKIISAITDESYNRSSANDVSIGMSRKKVPTATTTNIQFSAKLSPHTLKRDIKRCLNESQYYLNIGSGLYDYVTWKNPLATLCLFGIYMYGVWRGWLVPLFLSLILAQFGLNWLEKNNMRFNLFLFPCRVTPIKHDTLSFAASDLSGAQLVFDVARRAQNLLTLLADILEKLRALANWQRPKVTAYFVGIVATFFFLSLILSTSYWFILIGFLIGGKIFIMTYLYYRFPRLRPLLDIAYCFYKNLPTANETRCEKVVESSPPLDSRRFSMGQSFSFCRNRKVLPSLSSRSFGGHMAANEITRHASGVDIAVAVATASNFATLGSISTSKISASAMLSPLTLKGANGELSSRNRRRSICVMSVHNSRSTTSDSFRAQSTQSNTMCTSRGLTRLSSPITRSQEIECKNPPESRRIAIERVASLKMEGNDVLKDIKNYNEIEAPKDESKMQTNEYQVTSSTPKMGNEVATSTTTSSGSASSTDESGDNLSMSSISSNESMQELIWRRNCATQTSRIGKRAAKLDTSDEIFRIARPCLMTDCNRLFYDSVKSGMLIMSERMLSFHFNSYDTSKGVLCFKKIFGKNERVNECGPIVLDIPFTSILFLKKVDTKSIYQATGPKSSKIMSMLQLKNTSSSMGGLELCLTGGYVLRSCRISQDDVHSQNVTHAKRGHFVVRFTNISRRDEFYDLLVDTARITADVDLAG